MLARRSRGYLERRFLRTSEPPAPLLMSLADDHGQLDVNFNVAQWDAEHYYPDGTPCWNDGKFGAFQDTLCIVVDRAH